MYRVRPANRGDVARIEQVDLSVVGRHHGRVLTVAIGPGRVLVAAEDRQVLGYLRWEIFWDTIPLCLTVRVLAEHRRWGIGRALYGATEEAFRAAGAAFWLSSTEETNERSLLFHEALGFRRIGMLGELGQDVGEIFLRKDLD